MHSAELATESPQSPRDAVQVLATGAHTPSTPSWRIRVTSLASQLVKEGVDLRAEPLFETDSDWSVPGSGALRRAAALLRARPSLERRLAAVHEASVVLVHRQVDIHPSLRLERRAILGRRLVLDVDDAIWLDGPASGGHPLARLKLTARKLSWLASRASAVIAGNEYLAEYLSRWSRRVTIIPSTVDVGRQPPRLHEQGETLTLGWIGSRTTAPYLDGIVAPLTELARELHPRRICMICVGGTAPRIRGIETLTFPWSEDRASWALDRFDIGLMPLPDTPWTRGKCAFKAIQYMAAGIPVVADDVGMSAGAIGSGGLIVSTPSEWTDALRTLAEDAGLRATLGAKARSRAIDRYSTDRWVPEIARHFR